MNIFFYKKDFKFSKFYQKIWHIFFQLKINILKIEKNWYCDLTIKRDIKLFVNIFHLSGLHLLNDQVLISWDRASLNSELAMLQNALKYSKKVQFFGGIEASYCAIFPFLEYCGVPKARPLSLSERSSRQMSWNDLQFCVVWFQRARPSSILVLCVMVLVVLSMCIPHIALTENLKNLKELFLMVKILYIIHIFPDALKQSRKCNEQKIKLSTH